MHFEIKIIMVYNPGNYSMKRMPGIRSFSKRNDTVIMKCDRAAHRRRVCNINKSVKTRRNGNAPAIDIKNNITMKNNVNINAINMSKIKAISISANLNIGIAYNMKGVP